MMARTGFAALVFLTVSALATPALAGPPFLCHSFDIGPARSLPWQGHDWWHGRDNYQIVNVIADTEALLTPDTPVIVRMETLRRASLYASQDRVVAQRLLTALTGRAEAAVRIGQPDALAWFDAAYATEALNEIAHLAAYMKEFAGRDSTLAGLTEAGDGRALMQKSLALRPDDASIAFAAALISEGAARREQAHKARAAAEWDVLLARNLRHLGGEN